jgi:SAM-dependent methyltransferase
MKYTRSGEYKLPSPFDCRKGNLLLRMAKWAPAPLRDRFVRNRPHYQVFSESEFGENHEGLSIKKWEGMQMPSNLKGKSVIDIGCSEGFFCRQCAKIGAGPVMGVDTSLSRLLCASFIALREGLNIQYRMGVFPRQKPPGQYDYVLCLSVLHHSLIKKDVWKVLTRDEFADDLRILRDQFRILRSLTTENGRCVIEMPYEYDDPAEREEVDFERFNVELKQAGFARAQRLGSWEYNPKFQKQKDRIIYVAEA